MLAASLLVVALVPAVMAEENGSGGGAVYIGWEDGVPAAGTNGSALTNQWDWTTEGRDLRFYEVNSYPADLNCPNNKKPTVRVTQRTSNSTNNLPFQDDIDQVALVVWFEKPGEPETFKGKWALYEDAPWAFWWTNTSSYLDYRTFKPYRYSGGNIVHPWNDLKVQGPYGFDIQSISFDVKFDGADPAWEAVERDVPLLFKLVAWCVE